MVKVVQMLPAGDAHPMGIYGRLVALAKTLIEARVFRSDATGCGFLKPVRFLDLHIQFERKKCGVVVSVLCTGRVQSQPVAPVPRANGATESVRECHQPSRPRRVASCRYPHFQLGGPAGN